MSDPLLEQLQRTAALALQSQNTEEGVRHLTQAFRLFSEETARLKDASLNLQEKLQTVNAELTEANRSLVQKIAELGSVTTYLSNVLRNISQGILFIDLEGSITVLNEAASRLLAIEPTKALYQSFWSLFSNDFFGFSMREALKFGLSQKLIYKTLLIQCEAKDLEISTTFVLEGPKIFHGLIVVLRDITEMQKLQRIANQNDRMKELGEMAAIVAHEIRNPLGGIRGYAMLLHRDLAEKKPLQDLAGHLIEGTKSLERLVNVILQYAKPIEIKQESVEIGAFLKQIGRFVKVDPALSPYIRLEVHIPDDPILAPIDPDALKSALLNLIYNALQAMPEGGILAISLSKFDQHYRIAVSDTGIGMQPDLLKRLFAPFSTTKRKGTGLGLIEARKIVQAHGGTIEVRSELGQGSTFTLILPLYRKR